MVDVSGIPNMGFGGGGYFGGIPNQQPAMSAAQINAGMWGNYSPQQAQATLNNIYGAGGFGAQPAYYAGLGAAYGRQVAPSSPAAVAASNPNYQPSYGGWGGADQYLNDNPDVRQHAIDNALNAHDFAYQHASTYGANEGRNTYNAPRQYGWQHNEGADAPAAPQPYNKGEFNPQTYGWEHNEGAPVPEQPAQPDFNDFWAARGAWGLGRDNLFNSYTTTTTPQQPGGLEGLYQRMGLPQPWTSPMSPNAGAGWGGFDSGMGIKAPQQSSIWDTYGGADVQEAARAAGRSMADFGSEHARNYGLNEGRGIFDSAAYLNQNQDVKNAGVDAYQHYLQYGKNEGREAPTTTNRDVLAGLLSGIGQATATGTPAGTRSPVPDARTYMPPGQFGGYLDHYLWGANSGSLGSGSTFSGYGAQDTSSPMGTGGIGSDARYGAYPVGYTSPISSGGGIGSDARYGGYGAALEALRAGRGWSIADQPQAASQGTLANRINQGIYDIGNAGDAYSRAFGMNLPSAGQGTLSLQDQTIPHAYPPGFRR